MKTIKKGIHYIKLSEEVQLAEELVKIHKWADSVKFARTGAEANAIAVRLSRAYNKNKVIEALGGYHGWHDWYLSAKLSKSIHGYSLIPKTKS